MGLFVSTTGTSVIVRELGISLTHPATDYDLSSQFSPDDITRAQSLTDYIRNGTLLWRKTAAGIIQAPTDYDPEYLLAEHGNTGQGASADRIVLFKDLVGSGAVSASPGFTWARQGNTPNNTWLLNDGVPSNVTGRIVFLYSAVILKIFVSNQNISTYAVTIYQHDGDSINLSSLGTVTATAARGGEFDLNIPVDRLKHLALRITSGSVANVVAGLIVSGSLLP